MTSVEIHETEETLVTHLLPYYSTTNETSNESESPTDTTTVSMVVSVGIADAPMYTVIGNHYMLTSN